METIKPATGTVHRNEVAGAIYYALNHCDSEAEEAIVAWVAEKIAEHTYRDPQTPSGHANVRRFLAACGVPQPS